jgi:hypothetical protein
MDKARPNFHPAKGSAQHRHSISQACVNYERKKMQWDREHPDATFVERDAAMLRIAQECGV